MKLATVLSLSLIAIAHGQEITSNTTDLEPELDVVTTEDPKNRSCNACELEGCRRKCKETCRYCQYNFCHVDAGEYDCKCMRTPPPVAMKNDTDGPPLARVRRWNFPKRGRRIRNCKMH
ncbi:uncharacterized protein LOC100902855 [Galendromus occidentalis]|uniref:Uncharacterized protein LOC100902855 n=1 Tax=Galendromus occidentalis TaxID=34638 RepID=A0AAJ7SI39_9ACAR|nr:uncharacterized protein LOC100902855 [Galendromus occidentalis]